MTQDESNTNILEEVLILSALVYAVIKNVTEILILAEYVNNIEDSFTHRGFGVNKSKYRFNKL